MGGAAHREAEPLGLRVVLMRTGVVLGRDAEVVKRLALPFRLFAGAPSAVASSGSPGSTWTTSWASTAWRWRTRRRGPLNAVAPDTRRMKDVATELGRVLGPLLGPRPGVRSQDGPRGAGGPGAARAQGGAQRALALGYQFKYPDLPGALAQALGGS